MIKNFIPGITRVLANITPVLIFFIFAQVIKIEELGTLNYIISLITIIGILTSFGIPEASQRFLPQTKNKEKLITYILKLNLLIVLMISILFVIIEIITPNDLSKGYLPLLILTILFSISNTTILIFNGLDKQKEVTKYFTLSSMFFLLTTLAFYFVLKLDPILSFILGRLISWGIWTIIPVYQLIKNDWVIGDRLSIKKEKTFNNFALNTLIYIGSITIITQWDSILITQIDGEYINGIYKSVAFIATIPIVLVTILHTRLLPFFSQLNAKKKYLKIQKYLKTNIIFLTIFLITINIISYFIYKPILKLFLNDEIIQNAGHLFPIILFGTSIQILITPFVSYIQAIGKEKIITKTSIIQVLIFILLSIHFYTTYSYNTFPYLITILNTLVLITLGSFSYFQFKIIKETV